MTKSGLLKFQRLFSDSLQNIQKSVVKRGLLKSQLLFLEEVRHPMPIAHPASIVFDCMQNCPTIEFLYRWTPSKWNALENEPISKKDFWSPYSTPSCTLYFAKSGSLTNLLAKVLCKKRTQKWHKETRKYNFSKNTNFVTFLVF